MSEDYWKHQTNAFTNALKTLSSGIRKMKDAKTHEEWCEGMEQAFSVMEMVKEWK